MTWKPTDGKEEKMRIAKQLKKEGCCYRYISEKTGVDETTLRLWVEEGYRERRKEYTRCYKTSLRGRIMVKLVRTRHKALVENHVACTASIDDLIKTWTGKCWICGIEGKELASGRMLSLDHCHKTGKFRGWLCVLCNSLLGYVKDDKDTLRKAIEYLEKRG